MKIQSTKIAQRKRFIIGGIVAILIAAGSLTYVYGFNGNLLGWTAQNKTVQDNESTEQKDASNKIKEKSVNADTDKKPSTEDEQTPSPQPTPQTSKKQTGITITAAAQNGATLQIRTLIDIVASSGTCQLILAKSSAAMITKTTTLEALPSSSTCRGFDVPTQELSPGEWTAKVTFENNSYSASTSKEITIN